ncbi:MAG: hypothetical protein WD069_07560 [Planctomycetales bacterium]
MQDRQLYEQILGIGHGPQRRPRLPFADLGHQPAADRLSRASFGPGHERDAGFVGRGLGDRVAGRAGEGAAPSPFAGRVGEGAAM